MPIVRAFDGSSNVCPVTICDMLTVELCIFLLFNGNRNLYHICSPFEIYKAHMSFQNIVDWNL